ncbi:hypothetical protein PG993_008472 [Apiospora rasikravindrae]|uniref:Uncharacterized protein n=1 Tax=Apiospora rasikravindrae TaxID=990691 RepID=A0ABR1T0F4_9PEZI
MDNPGHSSFAEPPDEDSIYSKTVVLAKDGDLLIKVKDENYGIDTFLVDSSTVSRSFVRWKELMPAHRDVSGHYVIELSGDFNHYETVLAITHDRYDKVNQPHDIRALFYLVQFTEEHQVTYLLQPWAHIWLEAHSECLDRYEWSVHQTLETMLVRLWTAWMFGHREIFLWLTELLVKETFVDKKSQLVYGGAYVNNGPEKFNILEIPGLLNYVKREQKEKMQELRSAFNEFLESDYGQVCTLTNRPEPEQRMCEATIVGSLFIGHRKVSDLIKSVEAENSIGGLFRAMWAIPIQNLPAMPDDSTSMDRLPKNDTPPPRHSHDCCNPRYSLRERLDEVVSSIVTVLDKDLERRLHRQSRLFGGVNAGIMDWEDGSG